MEILEHNLEKVGVVGGGAREHVLADTIAQHNDVQTVYGFPGNPAFDDMVPGGESVGIPVSDHDGIVSFARQEGVGFMVIGPETPLIAGLADHLRVEGIKTMGPSADGARFEGSKIFTHNFNRDNNILQPRGIVKRGARELMNWVTANSPRNYVMKADGEAAGKGVGLPDSYEEALEFANRLINGDLKEAAARGVLLQERIDIIRPEVSAYTLIDCNRNFIELGAAQDHKRQLDGDGGPNTGGMGAYSPVPGDIYGEHNRQQQTANIEKFVAGLDKDNIDFDGALFSGLMLDQIDDGNHGEHHINKVLEYNVRFGDPEAQVVLPQYGGYLLELLLATAEGRLDQMQAPAVSALAHVCIVLCAENYPDSSPSGIKIQGLDKDIDPEKASVYMAGVKKEGEEYVTAGGRVVSVVGHGATHEEARANAEATIGEDGIHWPGMRNRSDIAHQAIKSAA